MQYRGFFLHFSGLLCMCEKASVPKKMWLAVCGSKKNSMFWHPNQGLSSRPPFLTVQPPAAQKKAAGWKRLSGRLHLPFPPTCSGQPRGGGLCGWGRWIKICGTSAGKCAKCEGKKCGKCDCAENAGQKKREMREKANNCGPHKFPPKPAQPRRNFPHKILCASSAKYLFSLHYLTDVQIFSSVL